MGAVTVESVVLEVIEGNVEKVSASGSRFSPSLPFISSPVLLVHADGGALDSCGVSTEAFCETTGGDMCFSAFCGNFWLSRTELSLLGQDRFRSGEASSSLADPFSVESEISVVCRRGRGKS